MSFSIKYHQVYYDTFEQVLQTRHLGVMQFIFAFTKCFSISSFSIICLFYQQNIFLVNFVQISYVKLVLRILHLFAVSYEPPRSFPSTFTYFNNSDMQSIDFEYYIFQFFLSQSVFLLSKKRKTKFIFAKVNLTLKVFVCFCRTSDYVKNRYNGDFFLIFLS